MTEKQKEFLLADISARLPYGVKCAEIYPDGNKFENVWDIIRVSKYVEDGIHISNCKTIYGYCSQIQNIKPYLFPLSSMTEEQWMDTPYANLNKFTFDSFKCGCSTLAFETYEVNLNYVVEFINWCYKNHFDINGLIPDGLAEDATNLNIY
jgi:hypothetical protein